MSCREHVSAREQSVSLCFLESKQSANASPTWLVSYRKNGWCPVPEIRGILPEVSWLFFKARAKRPYLSHTGRASNAEKQPTGPGPEGCDENGPAAALLVGHVSVQICSLLTPCRRPILITTKYLVFRGQDTSLLQKFSMGHAGMAK